MKLAVMLLLTGRHKKYQCDAIVQVLKSSPQNKNSDRKFYSLGVKSIEYLTCLGNVWKYVNTAEKYYWENQIFVLKKLIRTEMHHPLAWFHSFNYLSSINCYCEKMITALKQRILIIMPVLSGPLDGECAHKIYSFSYAIFFAYRENSKWFSILNGNSQ